MTALQNQKNEGVVQYNMSNKPFIDSYHLFTKGPLGCVFGIKTGHIFHNWKPVLIQCVFVLVSNYFLCFYLHFIVNS